MLLLPYLRNALCLPHKWNCFASFSQHTFPRGSVRVLIHYFLLAVFFYLVLIFIFSIQFLVLLLRLGPKCAPMFVLTIIKFIASVTKRKVFLCSLAKAKLEKVEYSSVLLISAETFGVWSTSKILIITLALYLFGEILILLVEIYNISCYL